MRSAGTVGMLTPCDRPSSDMVSLPSISTMSPPIHDPWPSMLSPDVGEETWHSSGWIDVQWKHSW